MGSDTQSVSTIINRTEGDHLPAIPTDSMPFLLRNVVRYEDGVVSILDRRSYPFQVESVICRSYNDVADAIKSMVTQSEGPGFCAGYGMVQAARVAETTDTPDDAMAVLKEAQSRLVATRPTNNHIRLLTSALLETATQHLDREGDHRSLEPLVLKTVEDELLAYRKRAARAGAFAADLLDDGDTVLTHCWAESALVYAFYYATEENKAVRLCCTETRPYLQGARLTADAIADLGVPVQIVTDGTPAHLMSEGFIDKYLTGADRVTMDGHVINKIGTLQIALSADAYGVPYYPLCYGPDPQAATASDVEIEVRDPSEVQYLLGQRTATHKAGAIYPAFDITPPRLIAGLVTDRGLFPAFEAPKYFEPPARSD